MPGHQAVERNDEFKESQPIKSEVHPKIIGWVECYGPLKLYRQPQQKLLERQVIGLTRSRFQR